MPFYLPHLLIGALAAGAIAVAALQVRFLKPSGAIATFLLGTVVFGFGGLRWSAPLIVFFVSGSLLSKYGPKRKRGLEQVFEKGSTRDAGQVWANGGIAGLIVIAHAISRDPLLFTAYTGALAAAAADTWGTEIGVLSRGRTWLLSTFRVVPRGASGGVSLVGTLGAAMGAFVVGASGIAWSGAPMLTMAIVIIAGMAGMVADGIIGATLQARYYCATCGTATEQSVHCGVPSRLVGGYRPITNDVVNTACTFTGAAVACVLARILLN